MSRQLALEIYTQEGYTALVDYNNCQTRHRLGRLGMSCVRNCLPSMAGIFLIIYSAAVVNAAPSNNELRNTINYIKARIVPHPHTCTYRRSLASYVRTAELDESGNIEIVIDYVITPRTGDITTYSTQVIGHGRERETFNIRDMTEVEVVDTGSIYLRCASNERCVHVDYSWEKEEGGSGNKSKNISDANIQCPLDDKTANLGNALMRYFELVGGHRKSVDPFDVENFQR